MTIWMKLLAGVVLLSVASQPVRAGEPGPDPAAVEILQRSMTYLAGLQAFRVETESTLEVVLETGQKIQYDGAATMTLKRPNKLYAMRAGLEQEFFYDGETLTLIDLDGDVYATVDAPATLDGMLDFAQTTLDITAPASDLLYSNAFDLLMEGVRSGFVVGTSFVAGVPCDQLAFSAPGTDWQIWIEQGERPLPRKLVITSRDVLSAPQFTTIIDSWDLAPEIDASTFDFDPPESAAAIGFVTSGDAN